MGKTYSGSYVGVLRFVVGEPTQFCRSDRGNRDDADAAGPLAGPAEFFDQLGVGVVLADVTSRALHYWSGSSDIYRVYPSSIPVSEDLTKRGLTEIVRKAKNPPWTPTPDMRRRNPDLPQRVEGGDPENPLGPYGLYLSWPAYLIHGTHDTRKIGRRSSNGCYGLFNEHITELYGMAEVGTQVAVF